MSPASKSKSKSKDKPAAKAAKEQQKTFKPSASTNSVSGSSASAYNPLSGTFHTIETTAVASSPSSHINGRFRNIDDTYDHSGSSHDTINEYDSVSNNGSSVDLDDLKEKIANTTLRQETVPGADNDKRDKIRIKNEKKHQRQREKRAHELHERCCGYIMSRKLEVLSQQLVAMGFSSERATLALILNEGKVEESVSWLFDGGEAAAQNKDTNAETAGNLKIDIIEELARIEAMEIKYKCSKQDVERATVAAEGDLEKAEEALKTQKQETPLMSPKSEEAVDSRIMTTQQEKPMASVLMQPRKNERDFNYTKATVALESVNNKPLPMKINQPKQSIVEKKSWPVTGSANLSVAYSVTPAPVAPPPAKMEARRSSIGHDVRNVQQSMVREPVIMMQRPKSINAKSNSISNGVSPYPVSTAGWYPNTALNFDNIKMNQNLLQNHNLGNYITENPNSQRFYHHHVDLKQHQAGGSINPVDIPPVSQKENSWNPVGNLSSSSSLTVPASLGLFSAGWGLPGSTSNTSSHLDWNTGGSSMPQCDYASIDWSLETNPSPSSRINGLWGGVSSLLKNSSNQGMVGHNSSRTNGVHATEPVVVQQEGASASSGVSREWTSPFAGQDIFSLPRQYVSSPSP